MSVEDRLAQILGDWQERRERGEVVPPEDVIRAHPDLEAQLRARFAALDIVERTYAQAALEEGEGPRRIGEYEIVKEIGRGGMGVVYEAEQIPMRRRVALKVLFPSITATERAVERFQREARAAGRLQHTNIVPVYGLGRDHGSWFYAMELVKGRSLDHVIGELCALGGAPGRAHLAVMGGDVSAAAGAGTYYRRVAAVFVGVAEALDKAHAEGVIHRDVKPSNLMLAADATLRLTDFGLARLEGESPGVTLTGERIGTPVYMSPEQARLHETTIDHRTDIYSLGVTLFETLTLCVPFSGSTPAAIFAQVMAREPARPRRLAPLIPKDLETIVLKAMEKDRERRYPTAGALARDLHAYAEGLTIQARRIGVVKRAWRSVKRNRTLALTVAGSLIVLLGAGVFFLSSLGEAQRKSEARRDAADDMAEFLIFEFKEKLQEVGRLDLLADAARRALEYYERLPAEDLTLDAQQRRATALQNMGEVLAQAGDKEAARSVHERRVDLLTHIVSETPQDDDARTDLLMSRLQLAEVMPRPEAVPLMQTALAEARRLARRDPEAPRWKWVAARILTELSLKVFPGPDPQPAFDASEEAVRILETLLETDPSNPTVLNDLERAREMYYHHRFLAGRYTDGMVTWFGLKLRRFKQRAERDPDNYKLKEDVAGWHYNLAVMSAGRGRTAEMLEHAREGARRYEVLHDWDPKSPSYFDMLAFCCGAWGEALRDLGRPEEALAPLERCLEIRKAQGKWAGVADLSEDLASLHKTLGNRDTALEWYRRAEDAYASSRDPAVPPDRASRKLRAWRLAYEGDHQAALKEWRAVLVGLEPGDDGTQSLGRRAEAHAAIGAELRILGHDEEAIEALRRALDLYQARASRSREHIAWELSVARTCLSLGEILATKDPDQREEARTLLEHTRAVCDGLEDEERFPRRVQAMRAACRAAFDGLDGD